MPAMIGPTVIGMRGPVFCAIRPDRDDPKSITTVLGTIAAPASNAEYPRLCCSCSATRNSAPPSAA
ncbi:Uncharacterised protein [Mycobacteroides abscessus subsp. abscessus]|nr:Uncharacterised protein [Mycobacteroides abscessus subsp. abscessus]